MLSLSASPLAKCALCALVAGACASTGSQQSDPSLTDSRYVNTLTVHSNFWLDVVIYVARSGARFRVGTVPGLGTETFRLSSALVPTQTVQLLADPIGQSETYLTDMINASPGQRIELRLGSTLNTSSFSVWSR